jgi:soluble lytic murein transglycosylase-like protein
MGSAHAHNRENTGGKGVSSGKLAPAGRVIRRAGKGSLAATSRPANCDMSDSVASTTPKRRLATVACFGLLLGVVLSLCAPSLTVLATSHTSEELFAMIKDDIASRQVKADRQEPAAPRGEQPRAQRESSRDDRELAKILTAAKVQAQSVRLAAYHVEPAVANSEEPVRSVSAIDLSHRGRTPALPSRTLVARVHSVIKKYSSKHTSAAQLAHAIVQESSRQGVDPLFVAAVIKSESAFNTFARSHKGAQGLMQIMPATGAWLVARNDLPNGKLTDPGHNLRLGISYLKYLEETYSGNRVFALVAYNWGPGHVDSAAGGRRRIPKECMKYALKIMQDYRRWSSGVI